MEDITDHDQSFIPKPGGKPFRCQTVKGNEFTATAGHRDGKPCFLFEVPAEGIRKIITEQEARELLELMFGGRN